MMMDLVKYEMLKLWKKMKMTYLIFLLVQSAILIIMIFIPESPEISIPGNTGISDIIVTLLMMLFFISSVVIIFVPIAESSSIFSNDLSGKQSTLELLLPPVTWKKIIAKLIVVLLHTMFCILLALLSIVLFFIAYVDHMQALMFLQDVFSKILLSICGIPIMCSIIYFSIATSKSLTHKKKIAIPIGIFMCVAIVTIYLFTSFKLEKFPLFQYNLLGTEMYLSGNLLDIIVFVIVFLGTTWLIDHKIEN